MVVEDQFVFKTTDGALHTARRWSRPGLVPDRGTIVCLHGIQSHSGWYGWSSTRLAQAGWSVNFPDRRGSGRSEAPRGDTPSAERLIADVVEFVREIQEVNAPCILLGLSWGARPAAILAARHPELFRRLILLYPGIHTHVRPTFWQRQAIRGATWCGAGGLRVSIPLTDPALFTRDTEGQAFIRNDRLALHQLTLRFLTASDALADEANGIAERIRIPTLMLLAGNDRIVDNEAARAWYHRIPVLHKELDVIEGAEHTFEFDPERERYIGRMTSWLDGVPAVSPASGPVSATTSVQGSP